MLRDSRSRRLNPEAVQQFRLPYRLLAHIVKEVSFQSCVGMTVTTTTIHDRERGVNRYVLAVPAYHVGHGE